MKPNSEDPDPDQTAPLLGCGSALFAQVYLSLRGKNPLLMFLFIFFFFF